MEFLVQVCRITQIKKSLNYSAFNDGNSNKQLLDTYLTPKWVCNLSDQKIIPNFILRMSNVI